MKVKLAFDCKSGLLKVDLARNSKEHSLCELPSMHSEGLHHAHFNFCIANKSIFNY